MAELKVGSQFWALQIIGSYGPCGDPFDFTVVDETKTLWRIRRSDDPDHKPFNIKKDMSEWHQITAEDAAKISWVRKNSSAIKTAVNRLTSHEYQTQLENYHMLKAVADVLELGAQADAESN